ncbi:MAG: FHA domain-containing protein [Planctomycetes bacterium]|nr:FHA domain-containing protein [Planctomycetota bacterium]
MKLIAAQTRSGIQLAATARQVRVTAGAGSAGQKTWNLRRPVTLIGARRPAHIILHGKDVSAAHCVFVNTGEEVLIKDLHTSGGTLCNGERVDLAPLNDGDVVTIGATTIQIAIRMPENEKDDSGIRIAFVEPTKFREPVSISLEGADKQWSVEDAVSLIGRHWSATINLDAPGISNRHALLFRFAGEPAIFDLGSRSGVSINENPISIGPLHRGDRIGIGPLTLMILPGPQDTQHRSDAIERPTRHGLSDPPGASTSSQSNPDRAIVPLDICNIEQHASGDGTEPPLPSLGHIQTELNALESNISESWDRLNNWQSRLKEDESSLDAKTRSLAARRSALNAKDAALRGHLHDVTCFHEQVLAREKELGRQLTAIQEERDEVQKAVLETEKREQEVTRRLAELRRREHVVAQRWTKLQRAACPHCGKSLQLDAT